MSIRITSNIDIFDEEEEEIREVAEVQSDTEVGPKDPIEEKV